MRSYKYDCIVIGTGAAGYNAVLRLHKYGKNTALVTEDINCGTSRNAGSDKQTYYKLGLGGKYLDSVRQMAEDLFGFGSVDGDNALCEAALSTRCFINLCEAGVGFPHNRYGEYIGYKTDHDPYARATSAGPLTSKFMTEALQNEAEKLGINIIDKCYCIKILKNGNSVCGLLGINTDTGEIISIKCSDIIMCTGGPAGIYADSVFPLGHYGSTGLALAAGAKLQNITEWQFGLASVNPRWNVSGTYMQVLPRFFSVDKNGNENEFLIDYFGDPYTALSKVFLKGYQWPFDSKKALNGSSVIDLLVYRETVIKGNSVYLDYTRNPFGFDKIDFNKLSEEAFEYLSRAGACFGTPIERLEKMNKPAIELYQSKGLDITENYLQIALCAQHNNGGIAVDMWWQTCVRGLFAAGECAGTHGISRPGGSALNAGQVGSLRAAQYVCKYPNTETDDAIFDEISAREAGQTEITIQSVLKDSDNVDETEAYFRRLMSDNGGAIREADKMRKTKEEIRCFYNMLNEKISVNKINGVYRFFRLKNILLTQYAVLTAMMDYREKIGKTRGSALYTDDMGNAPVGLEEIFRFSLDDGESGKMIQEICLNNDAVDCVWREVRPIPIDDDFFENVWSTFRKNGNVY